MLKIGTKAPEFSLPDQNGQIHTLSSYQGRKVILYFYRELFTESSKYLEKITGRSVEKNVLKGIGSASEAIGKAVGKIPIVEKGPVDEFLQSGGEKLKSSAERIESSILETFASVSNPGTGLFSEKLEEMRQIYNHTSELCFDDENIYLIAE